MSITISLSSRPKFVRGKSSVERNDCHGPFSPMETLAPLIPGVDRRAAHRPPSGIEKGVGFCRYDLEITVHHRRHLQFALRPAPAALPPPSSLPTASDLRHTYGPAQPHSNCCKNTHRKRKTQTVDHSSTVQTRSRWNTVLSSLSVSHEVPGFHPVLDEGQDGARNQIIGFGCCRKLRARPMTRAPLAAWQARNS